jgi:hypothetical protein
VAVIGGLTGYDGEVWKSWLGQKFGEAGGEKHVDMYWKGAWSGMMWVKFNTMDERNNAVTTVSWGLSGAWAAPDRPLEDRVVGSYLLGLKTLLVNWGIYDKRDVRVDMEAIPMTMKVRGHDGEWTTVGTARVQDGGVMMQWMDEWWKGWAELHADEEYKKLARIATEKLGKAKGGGTKGSGKGKSKAGKGKW